MTIVQPETSTPQPATAPRLTTSHDEPAVLKLAGKFIHCGEPMAVKPLDLKATAHAGTAERSPLRILRCACGFQMDLPRTSATD
ncbi:hypothetical protein [Arthrobacter ulcerisalmonis]|uniref:hypothetical protein n=1 Tax=Arthrobacter ulcerisalmonis TaxID=2483813 RepID=UPI000F540A56|nr:hypothetical protein [Arthrobacter ulcerisalmonis]